MTSNAKLTRSGEREIRIVREFDAPRGSVWRALTDPKLLAKWWGRGHRLTVERFELRAGGHWRFVEHTPDGAKHGFEGRFGEIVPPERISQTFEWDGAPAHTSFETMTLHDLAGTRTRLEIVTTFLFASDLDAMMKSGMEGGMNASYEALDRLLETLSSPRPSRRSRGSRRKAAPARGAARARRTARRRSSRT